MTNGHALLSKLMLQGSLRSHCWEQLLNHCDGSRSDQYHEDTWEDAKNQRENQSNRSLGRLLFSDLLSTSTHRVTLSTECFTNTGTEPVNLNQNVSQGIQVLDVVAGCQCLQYVFTGLTPFEVRDYTG